MCGLDEYEGCTELEWRSYTVIIIIKRILLKSSKRYMYSQENLGSQCKGLHGFKVLGISFMGISTCSNVGVDHLF